MKAQNAEENRKMRENGFVRHRVGYTFPGIDEKIIDNNMKINTLMSKTNFQVEKKSLPKISTKPLS